MKLSLKQLGSIYRCGRQNYWISKGNRARSAGKWKEAARCYGRTDVRRFELAEVLVCEGRDLSAAGRDRDAEVAYRKALEALPHHPVAYVELGNLMRLRGDRTKAAHYYLEALRRGCELTDDLADLLTELGATADAQAIVADPDRYPIEGQVGSFFWWHSIDLGNGLITPGRHSLARMAGRFDETFGRLDMNGKSVLDVGAWNGAFSVEAKRRGASRVVGLDHSTWTHPVFRGRATFDLVNRITGLGLETADIDLDHARLDLQSLGPFDIVLFLGVFYHLRDPLAALREVASRADEVLVVETHIERTFSRRPAMIYYPGDELGGDPTNWWAPNAACMTEMLKNLDFRHIEASRGSSRDRMIFHAYR